MNLQKLMKKFEKYAKKQTNDLKVIELSVSFLEAEFDTDYIYDIKDFQSKKECRKFIRYFWEICKECYDL